MNRLPSQPEARRDRAVFTRDASMRYDIGRYLTERLASPDVAENDPEVLSALGEIIERAAAERGSLEFRIVAHRDELEVQIGEPPQEPGPTASGGGGGFPEWLAEELRTRGLTQREAAETFGVSIKTVRRWLQGRTQPRMSQLARITHAFGPPPIS